MDSDSEESRSTPEAHPTAPEVGTRLSAKEIHENIREAAEEEMERPARELAYSALAAGLLISFSFLGGAYLASLVPASEPALRHAASSAGYPLGFIFVVLARNQLFTENTLEPVLPVLEEHNARTLERLLRLWAIVLPLNLVGAFVMALIIARTSAVPDTLTPALREIADHAASGGFGSVFYKAIFAGWLIALMAWLIGTTRETWTQIILIWLTTAPIAALGFKHSIAGAVEAFYRAAIGSASWGAMIGSFIIPAILGNIVGGVVLVAMINHGQAGEPKDERD